MAHVLCEFLFRRRRLSLGSAVCSGRLISMFISPRLFTSSLFFEERNLYSTCILAFYLLRVALYFCRAVKAIFELYMSTVAFIRSSILLFSILPIRVDSD